MIVWAFVFTMAPRPPAGAVPLGGEYYHPGTLVLENCTMPVGNSTPWQSVDVFGVRFQMHLVGCYSPGGLVLSGNASAADVANWSFSLSDRQAPDAAGWIDVVSPDGDVGVQWKGDAVRALVHV